MVVTGFHGLDDGPVGAAGCMAFPGKNRAVQPYHDFPVQFGY